MKQLRLIAPLLATASLVWCVFVGWSMWTTPIPFSEIYSSGVAGLPPMTGRTEGYRSFSQMSALGAIPLVVPVVLTGLAVWMAFWGRTMLLLVVTLLVLAYSVVTGFSIGSAYLPAGGVLVVATLVGFVCGRLPG